MAQFYKVNGLLFQLEEQRHRLFLGIMAAQFFHDLVVIRAYRTELDMKVGQLGVVVHQCLVHRQHLERPPEEVFLQENRSGINTGFLIHGEKPVPFATVETHHHAVRLRVRFWIPARFFCFLLIHITLNLVVSRQDHLL